MDESAIAACLYEWLEKERLALESGGSEPRLPKPQMNALAAELEKNLYPTVLAISAWIQKKWGIWYTVPGLTNLLHRLGFSYKQPCGVPTKANPVEQVKFREHYTHSG